ncbi:MAG: hypothetical protein K0Q95_2031 [Bacteroidota bacterium]|jgi:hypothetical protein|nr:hypothetical protein [Bacteroidota bacterium]
MKNKILKKLLFAIVLAFSFTGSVRASHIAGAELTYKHLSGNQFIVNLDLFVDCLGFDPGNVQTIEMTSTCGQTTTFNVDVLNPGGTEISQICPSQMMNTACNGGVLPGMWIFRYSDTVSLPGLCNTWTMAWTVCCRNNAITNLSSASSFGTYVETTLNTGIDSTNSSPYFTAMRIPYVCLGQLVNYNCAVVESDGDSLHFSLVSALDAGASPLSYSSGYSAASPIPGIAIDPLTGQLSFIPTAIGNYEVVVKVEEFDANSNLLGSVMRDIQFVVQNCSNNAPSLNSGAITNLSGQAIQIAPHTIYVCPGDSLSFDVIYSDVDAADSLSYSANIATALPGSIITSSGINPFTLHISWTAPAGMTSALIPVAISVQDNACPVYGIQSFVYNINVEPHMVISGSVNYAGSPVDGYAKLISHNPGYQMRMKDSVAIIGGSYTFPFVLQGRYIIQATPDTSLYPLAVPTYYDTVITWSSAADIVITPVCNDTTDIDIIMLGHPSLVGTNGLSGTLLEGAGYRSPGMGMSGVDVFLLNNSDNTIVDYTRTNSYGFYHFENIPSGCNRIYIDIPGLSMLSTYTQCVSSNNNLTELNFVADSTMIYVTNSVLASAEIKESDASLNVYPNPSVGNFTIECCVPHEGLISLEIYNVQGERISSFAKNRTVNGKFKIEIDENSKYSPGLYFIKLSTTQGTKIQKLIITQ